MAKKKEEQSVGTKQVWSKNIRKWTSPKTRASNYVEELKNKTGKSYTDKNGKERNPNAGKELTEFQLGVRSGYLQCQSDHAGAYKYKKALNDGYNKNEAKTISRCKQKYPTPFPSDKG